MTQQEILEKAIRRAIDGGWKNEADWYYDKGLRNMDIDYGYYTLPVSSLIFDHDFAKALWGEGYQSKNSLFRLVLWKMHLQQMVIAEDPIKYLGENI